MKCVVVVQNTLIRWHKSGKWTAQTSGTNHQNQRTANNSCDQSLPNCKGHERAIRHTLFYNFLSLVHIW